MKNGADALMKAAALQWLRQWEALINAQDFARARSLFSQDVISFGTFAEILNGLDELEALQWRTIWPTIADFTFEETHVLVSEASPQIVTIVTLWRSKGKTKNAGWYDRKGRATLILKSEDDRLRCIHSHLSMAPGIPPRED
jgi:ketosteroid isomerase-like protein